jgi:predicted nicotinamide N-methyase
MSEVETLLNAGYFVDPYTGLFSIPSPYIEATHSFNLAHFIGKHPQHFFGKNILTVCADFGILNIQAKMSGLNIVSSVQKEYYNVGTVLTCIGNNSPPYPINVFDFPEEDVVFMSCVFQEDDLAYKNWEMMIDMRISGKEVFFTSNSYFYLRRYMNYDRIELVIDPRTVYNEEDYADIAYGYMNRIYRMK